MISDLPEGLVRPRDDRVIAGVAAGVAHWLGVEPVIVRLAVVVLALANGVGVVLYLAAWVVLPDEGVRPSPADAGAAGAASRASGGRGAGGRTAELALAVGSITLGVLLLTRWTAPFFPDELVWPAALAATGVATVWTQAGEADRARWREISSRLPASPVRALRSGAGLWARLLVGAALLIVGIGLFLASNETFSAVGQIGVAVLATGLGVALLLGPWIVRLWQQLAAERRERIRTEARADMAAHLHDSVLQTLALIQRHADHPEQARRLARQQERALRAWLYDDRPPDESPTTLAAALDRMADEVEADHGGVEVDVVVVGDRGVDPQIEALLGALREAVVNAASHSGAPEVSVYVEVAGDHIDAFVRDRGRGFDPASVERGRRGIAESIVGRMARHGGRATVHSVPGEGTEVSVELTCQPEVAT